MSIGDWRLLMYGAVFARSEIGEDRSRERCHKQKGEGETERVRHGLMQMNRNLWR